MSSQTLQCHDKVLSEHAQKVLSDVRNQKHFRLIDMIPDENI